MKLLFPLILLFSLVLLFKLSFKLLHLKNEQIVIPTLKLFKLLFPVLNYSHLFVPRFYLAIEYISLIILLFSLIL
jgi:hypothetical protein